ncbi:MAG: hypothetical protein M3Y44_16155 [Actinomycetota bacterium]|nr:hypothetical protein [Actinomycetota bacterium]
MITDPRFAPRRNDLAYLRRRSRKKLRAAAATPPTREPSAANGQPQVGRTQGGRPDAAVADYFSGHRPTRAHSPAAAAPAAPAVPAAPPARAAAAAAASSSLDLDGPAVAPPAASSSLDLDSPAPATAAPRPTGRSSTSLDLGAGAAPASSRSGAPAAPRAPSVTRRYPVIRVSAGSRTILSRKAPTVTLTRTQTGIGTLTFEAAVSGEVGDLRMGCAYELRSGLSSTVQLTGGNRLAPSRSRRPVLVAAHERYERISVDLRQSPDIERLAVYAFSESRAQLRWGGTLIVTTFAGAKIEVPLEHLAPGEVAVLLSVYNVNGEFVLRAELETIAGSIREAARAYGYDQISWLDDRTPVE